MRWRSRGSASRMWIGVVLADPKVGQAHHCGQRRVGAAVRGQDRVRWLMTLFRCLREGLCDHGFARRLVDRS
jgi:hypothetical protein